MSKTEIIDESIVEETVVSTVVATEDIKEEPKPKAKSKAKAKSKDALEELVDVASKGVAIEVKIEDKPASNMITSTGKIDRNTLRKVHNLTISDYSEDIQKLISFYGFGVGATEEEYLKSGAPKDQYKKFASETYDLTHI